MKKIIGLFVMVLFVWSCDLPLGVGSKELDSVSVARNDSLERVVADSLSLQSVIDSGIIKAKEGMQSFQGKIYPATSYPYGPERSRQDSAFYHYNVTFLEDPVYPFKNVDGMRFRIILSVHNYFGRDSNGDRFLVEKNTVFYESGLMPVGQLPDTISFYIYKGFSLNVTYEVYHWGSRLYDRLYLGTICLHNEERKKVLHIKPSYGKKNWINWYYYAYDWAGNYYRDDGTEHTFY